MSAGKSFITLTKEDRSPAVLNVGRIRGIADWGTKTEVRCKDVSYVVMESAEEIMKRMGKNLMNGVEVVVECDL